MSSKNAITPLKHYTKFGSSFIHTVEQDGTKYYYAALTINTGNTKSDYDFPDAEFKVAFNSCAGYVQGNQKWLLGTVPQDEATKTNKTFDPTIKGYTDGKFAIKKEETEDAIQLWNKTNNLVAINCEGVPIMEYLAEQLYAKKILAKFIFRINLKLTQEEINSQLSPYFDTYIEYMRETGNRLGNAKDSNPEAYAAILLCNKYFGSPPMIFKDGQFDLPEIDEIDSELNLPTGNKIKVSVPFKGDTVDTITDFIFNPPDPPEASKNGGYRSNGSVNNQIEIGGFDSDKSWKWFTEHLTEIGHFLSGSGFAVSKISQIKIAMAFSGVANVPQVNLRDIEEKEETETGEYLFPKPYLRMDNGKAEKIPESKEIKAEKLIEPTTILEVVPVQEEIKTDERSLEILSERLKKRFTSLKLNYDKWVNLHNNIEEISAMLDVVESQTFIAKKDDVETWVGTVAFQMDEHSFPVTALKKPMLLKLATLVKDNDLKLQIDQDATII